MSARSEESLKKDDNDGKSDSNGDFFYKIRPLFGDAICQALQSKLKFLFIRRACTPEDLRAYISFTICYPGRRKLQH